MKPRTKIEKRVLALSKELRPIPDKCKEYAYSLFPLTAMYQKGIRYKKMGKVWCQKCGFVEKVSCLELGVSLEMTHTCQKCGADLELQHDRSFAPNYEEIQVAFFETHKKWEVARVFKVVRYNVLGKPTKYVTHELYQIWLSEIGEEVICGLKYTRSPFCTNWIYNSEFDIKFHNASTSSSYAFDDMFDVSDCYIYPRIIATKRLYRNGWTSKIIKDKRVNIVECMKALLSNPSMETLVKQGQYSIFRSMICSGRQIVKYQQSLNICHRNNYIIQDASLWYDYMDALTELELDTHNAYYVCPSDLKEAHDSIMRKLHNKREKEKREEMFAEVQLHEKAYFLQKNKYLGIHFTNGLIDITVLQSVKEFLEEGTAMHHCVYDMEYYKKENSLILSAKIKGERLETIEVDLKSLTIIQSRAVCNGKSKYHDEIINLINKNMNLIKACA